MQRNKSLEILQEDAPDSIRKGDEGDVIFCASKRPRSLLPRENHKPSNPDIFVHTDGSMPSVLRTFDLTDSDPKT